MKKTKHNLEEMQGIASSRGGKCLSREYVNYESKLKWQCDKEHEWETTPAIILKGRWCPHCAHKAPLTIEEMQEIAKSRGGKCLSTDYLGNTYKLKWQCIKGHEWEAMPKTIKRGGWCPLCALNKPEIAYIQSIATTRGGKCLSLVFIDNRSKLKWQCDKGHEWETRLSVIESGSWCPVCGGGMGEHICRIFFEKLFNSQFNKARPNWLISESGTRLELDGYNQELKIAFEHQGLQHYEHVERFHKINDLRTLQARDKIKKIKCMEQGVNLFVIPAIPDLLALEKVESFIRRKAHHLKIQIPNTKTIDINSMDIYIRQDKLIEFQNIASSRGGECLSSEYLSNGVNLKWQCDKGHIWEAKASSVKKGTWCPLCAFYKKRLTIEEMQDIATHKGGKCLSSVYINNFTKLKWRCDKGHEWEATPDGARSGYWCINCAGLNPLTIEEMQDIALSKGGKCLSTKYVNSRTKLKWQCDKGHEWEMAPSNIKSQNQWCPRCAHKAPLTIEEMQDIAKSRDGKCLSAEYINSTTKLMWQCDKGHIWQAIPSDVKTGHWCPRCAGHARLTIEEMQDIAKSRDGKCLSEKYVNNRTKLKWKCSKGHEWEAKPDSVKTGTWCPSCYILNHKV